MGKHSGRSFGGYIKTFYTDSYKWDIIKSIGLFVLGIRIAHEFIGVEIMPAVPQ